MKVSNVMFSLLRYVINGEEVSEELKNSINPELLSGLYKLSKMHDLSHLVCVALDDNGLLDNNKEMAALFRQQRTMAVYRVEQIQYELKEICSVFEESGIAYIPLKGSIVRRYYPESWFRTCCDIDVLVKEEQLQAAVNALMENLGYVSQGKAYHDISMLSPSGVHLELHFNILEKQANIDALLRNVWDYARPVENKRVYEMCNEFLMFHMIAHSYYHFLHGGCGVRTILDLYILEKEMPYDKDKVTAMLAECGITKYYEAIRSLATTWFENVPMDETLADVQTYILYGGIYGNLQNRIAVQQVQVGGKSKYLWCRIFMPYDDLKEIYPNLKGKKWLFPFYQVKRWCKLLFGGRLKRSMNELNVNISVSEKEKQRTEKMMQMLELK